MGIRINNYYSGYKIVSLALDQNTKNIILEQKLNCLYIEKSSVYLFPENISLDLNVNNISLLLNYNNFDVLELWEDGELFRKYNDKSNDNYFFITGKCNSNCIMCPSPEYARRHSNISSLNNLLELANHIPEDVSHLTITGGEPFIMRTQIFEFLKYLKSKFTFTEFLLLTNGRALAIQKYIDSFCENAPKNIVVAIPLHGSCEKVHDEITQTKDSFKQTLYGINNLLNNNISVEIRLVVNNLNIYDFNNIANLIINKFSNIEYVSIIAMEMTGSAWENREKVWIPYKESFGYVKTAIEKLIRHGIDVKLYNFPLCTVERTYWYLCEKSISENKIRFLESCNVCKYKHACSGVFSGSLQLEGEELIPIL